ncbi:MAG: aminotransferase class I/II-fold pyridoxal phosphate-dependent enzyme, partial [Pseudomonadota bacterium]
ESSAAMINEYPNLLVIQTLSKSRSLAGLRVGFALGHEELIEGLGRIKDSMNSYTLDRLALLGAAEAINDEGYFKETTKKIIATRERTSGELNKFGFTIIPSRANFIFIRHPQYQASVLFQRLRDRGVLVRYFNLPRIDNYLRVTIGSDEEMRRFLGAVKEIITL